MKYKQRYTTKLFVVFKNLVKSSGIKSIFANSTLLYY